MKIIRVDSHLINSAPGIHLMADSAWRPDRRPLFLPDGSWECEIRPAIRIERLGKAISAKFARRYYNEFALVNYLKPADKTPSAEYDMMDDAIIQGPWNSVENLPTEIGVDTDELDRLIERLSESATFKTGDMIVLPNALQTYTPEIGARIAVQSSSDNSTLIEFTIK